MSTDHHSTLTPKRHGIGSRLSLKPYGDELMTGSSAFWIFSARLIILAMAAAEAMAWGYMGSLMSPAHPVAAAGIAASFIFVLIWIIDSSFMTLDLSGSYYDRCLTVREPHVAKERLRLTAGVVARIGIVTASLLITAPFLAQAIFSEDVRNEMARRNAATVAVQRQALERPYLERRRELREEQSALELQRVQEAAGVGPSGRYGRGPALETIERQLEEKRAEIRALDETRAATLTSFDALTPSEREDRHGVQLLTAGIRTSTALLDDMMADPKFDRAELAVRAFLGILFVGLLILKLFQPRSADIYYSERLHSLYDEYRKGIFDDYLPTAERALDGGDIEPIRFEDWCLETFPIIRREEKSRHRTASERRIHESLIEELRQLGLTAQADLDSSLGKHEQAIADLQQLESALQDVRAHSASEAEELETLERSRASLREHLEQHDMDGPTFERAMTASRQMEERRRSLMNGQVTSDGKKEELSKRIEHLRENCERLRREVDSKRTATSEYQNRIHEERRSYSERIAREHSVAGMRADGSMQPLHVSQAMS